MTEFSEFRGRMAGFAAACTILAGLSFAGAGSASTAQSSIRISIEDARTAKGSIRLALCPADAPFPECGARAVRTITLPIANGKAQTMLTGITPGRYAVGVFHDANNNGKLDTFLGIPKEGFGFSRNPSIKPRAPRFSECEFDVKGDAAIDIKLRYIL